MKEIRYKGELIATYDGEHTYLTDWAEELLRVFVSEPTSDERCKWIEVRTKNVGKMLELSCTLSLPHVQSREKETLKSLEI